MTSSAEQIDGGATQPLPETPQESEKIWDLMQKRGIPREQAEIGVLGPHRAEALRTQKAAAEAKAHMAQTFEQNEQDRLAAEAEKERRRAEEIAEVIKSTFPPESDDPNSDSSHDQVA